MALPAQVGLPVRARTSWLALSLAWVSLVGFIVAAAFASVYPYFPADLWVSHRLQGLSAAAFERALAVASYMVEPPLVVLMILGTTVWLFLGRHIGWAVLFVLEQAVRGLNALVKELVDRPRPSSELVAVHELPTSPSFPSGHVVSALVAYGFLLYLSGLIPWWPARWGVRLVCLYVIAFTAMERIHTGAHWLSDVYGAFLFCLAWLALAVALRSRLVRHQASPPAS
jgi:membrane-associated phospholipid phosphatase